MKPKLFVSFSGGKSSGRMARFLKAEYADKYDLLFVFSNTGVEDERTFFFINECDQRWELKLVWVEAVTHHKKGIACSHRIVTYETASRNGEPFEAMIKKYGIPNKSYPHCTRELKMNPMHSYVRSVWGDAPYLTAIGLRADEKHRARKDAEKAGIVYPLIDWLPTDKPDVNDWWAAQGFDLGMDDYEGNCVWCWKKSNEKLYRLARENPAAFTFPARMEGQYGIDGYNIDGTPRVFFRGNTSTQHLLRAARTGNARRFREDPDEDAGCAESCDINMEIGQ